MKREHPKYGRVDYVLYGMDSAAVKGDRFLFWFRIAIISAGLAFLAYKVAFTPLPAEIDALVVSDGALVRLHQEALTWKHR